MLYEFDQSRTQALFTQADPERTDEQLMSGIQNHNEDDLAALCRRHTPLLRTIIARVVNNDADVDDVLQDVYVEIWNRAGRYEETKGKPLGWMVTLARRRAIDRVRRKQAYARAGERLRETVQGDMGSMYHPSTDSEAMNGDVAETFQRLLSSLPTAQREAVQYAYYGGLSQRDIARRTGIPLGTIKTRLELALRKMRTGILALGGEAEWHFMQS